MDCDLRKLWMMYALTIIVTTVSGIKNKSTESGKENATTRIVTTTESVSDGKSTSLAITTTVCPSNSSCSKNVSTIPGTTTSRPKTSKPKNKKKADESIVNSKTSELCTCNLKRNQCDINCCCDIECLEETKIIFAFCEEDENIFYDTRYCNYMKYIYINNTLLEWQVNQNSLFCIVKRNLPPSYTLQRKQPLLFFSDAVLQKFGKYSWPGEKMYNLTDHFESNATFKYGKPLWVMYKNRTLNIFKLPASFITDACLIDDNVLALNNFHSKCSHSEISEKNEWLSPEKYFRDIYFISAPNHFKKLRYLLKNIIKFCPRNVCLPMKVYACDDIFENCSNLNPKNKFSCKYEVFSNTNTCTNIVKKVNYNFYYNGTLGLSKVDLFLKLRNFSYQFNPDDPISFTQEFQVNFMWSNHIKNFSNLLSGNPGYIVGKPLLIADKIFEGNTTKVILHRNQMDYTTNFMVLPEKINGICSLSNTTNIPIEFGYNLRTNCKIKDVLTKQLNRTATAYCQELQKLVLSYWSVELDSNKSIGMFGNADASKTSEWIQVLYKISPQALFNKTTGKFSSKNETLYCFGIISSVSVDVYHSRIDFENLRNQEKILATTFEFGNVVNISLAFETIKNQKINFSLPIESQVMFYDITARKKKRFVDPPTFEIKLPYDFFYPFVRIGNNSNRITAWHWKNIAYFFAVYVSTLLLILS